MPYILLVTFIYFYQIIAFCHFSNFLPASSLLQINYSWSRYSCVVGMSLQYDDLNNADFAAGIIKYS